MNIKMPHFKLDTLCFQQPSNTRVHKQQTSWNNSSCQLELDKLKFTRPFAPVLKPTIFTRAACHFFPGHCPLSSLTSPTYLLVFFSLLLYSLGSTDVRPSTCLRNAGCNELSNAGGTEIFTPRTQGQVVSNHLMIILLDYHYEFWALTWL